MSEADEKVTAARREARRARVTSLVWWAMMPVVCVTYWFVSTERPIEKAMLVFLAAVSIIANAATYSAKAKAAEAKAAGYENP